MITLKSDATYSLFIENNSEVGQTYQILVSKYDSDVEYFNGEKTDTLKSCEVRRYQYTAPSTGRYKITITDSDEGVGVCYRTSSYDTYQYVYGNTMVSLSAYNTLDLLVYNLSATKASVTIQVEEKSIVNNNIYVEADLNNPEELSFQQYGDIYYLSIPVEEAGYYTINGQVDVDSNADFLVDCLNDEGNQVNIYNSESAHNRDLPSVYMDADAVIEILVWPYFASDYEPTKEYGENITITITKNDSNEESTEEVR